MLKFCCTMKIEIPKPEDAEEIFELLKRTWLNTYVNAEYNITKEDILSIFTNEKKSATLAKMKTLYEALKNDFHNSEKIDWIAREGNEIIGVMRIKNNIPGEIVMLYVKPSMQGKGVGRKLMNRALEDLDNREILLKVAKYNTKAIRFYEKYGFRIYGNVEDPHGQLPTGKIIPEVGMVKNKLDN
jgi:ribosomal protein S18 acetylase RimI-like enzyme